MGADLYIESLSEKALKKYEPLFEKAVAYRDSLLNATEFERAQAQKEVSKYYDLMHGEGYFRDSYNGTSVLHVLGLSWWSNDFISSRGYMSVANAKKFKKLLESLQCPRVTKEYLEKNHCVVTKTGPDSVKGWQKYFDEKRVRLITFLDTAIKLKEKIRCSV